MGIVCRIRSAFCASAVLAMLAGCSGGSSQVTPTPLAQSAGADAQPVERQVGGIARSGNARSDNSLLPLNAVRLPSVLITTPSFMDGDALGKALIFVSDAANGIVNIYTQAGKNQKKVGQITRLSEPQGLTTDTSGNLYVANTNGSNVLVFAPPYTSAPTVTLNDAGEFPADVAVSNTGVVAVTNICKAPRCEVSTGSVSFYAKGSTKACATVSDATYNFARVMFAAFDKAGTLYIDGLNSGSQTSIGVVAGGCKATGIANLGQVFTVGFPGGLQVDKADRLALADQVRELVDTFNPPIRGQLGSPVAETSLTGSLSPVGIALLASGNDLYTADSAGSGVSNQYDYAGKGKPENTIAVGGQPVGVAVTPPVRP